MSRVRAFWRQALLGGALSLLAVHVAQAGTYLVCYLPPDTDKQLIRFCPGASDAAAGEPCQCLQKTAVLTGTMTILAIPDVADPSGAATNAMCVPHAEPGAPVALCPAFHAAGNGSCTCDGGDGKGAGEVFSVTMMPRTPLRTNQTAAADFLKRLQECCVSR